MLVLFLASLSWTPLSIIRWPYHWDSRSGLASRRRPCTGVLQQTHHTLVPIPPNTGYGSWAVGSWSAWPRSVSKALRGTSVGCGTCFPFTVFHFLLWVCNIKDNFNLSIWKPTILNVRRMEKPLCASVTRSNQWTHTWRTFSSRMLSGKVSNRTGAIPRLELALWATWTR